MLSSNSPSKTKNRYEVRRLRLAPTPQLDALARAAGELYSAAVVDFWRTVKAERLGMRVVLQDETYTSQACPRCGSRHKPRGREYTCLVCGFRFHRDGVGAVNIRRKYLGLGPVVGAMASPTGVRWRPHQRTRVARDKRERIPAL